MKHNYSSKFIYKELTKLKLFLAMFLVASISFVGYSMASNAYAATCATKTKGTLWNSGYAYLKVVSPDGNYNQYKVNGSWASAPGNGNTSNFDTYLDSAHTVKVSIASDSSGGSGSIAAGTIGALSTTSYTPSKTRGDGNTSVNYTYVKNVPVALTIPAGQKLTNRAATTECSGIVPHYYVYTATGTGGANTLENYAQGGQTKNAYLSMNIASTHLRTHADSGVNYEIPSGTRTFTFTYSQTSLTVNFNANDATYDTVASSSVTDQTLGGYSQNYVYSGSSLQLPETDGVGSARWGLRKSGYTATNRWHVGSATGTTVSSGWYSGQTLASAAGISIDGEDKTVTLYADYTPIYTHTLNSQGATTNGTTKIYETSGSNFFGYWLDSNITQHMYAQSWSSTNYTITKPTKNGYTFKGYFETSTGGGAKLINANGYVDNQNRYFGTSKTFYASWEYTATPTITTSGCNTFTVSAPSGYSYHVSTTQTTAPSASASGWSTATSYTASSAGTYYVWVKDSSGNVSPNGATKEAYTISRSQGCGTTLTTRCNSTSATTGTAFTSNQVVLAGLNVWAKAEIDSNHTGTATLKHGSTTMTASGSYFAVNATETVTSGGATYSATPTITTTDHDTFSYSATGGSQYFVSKTQTTAPAADATGWTSSTSTGNLTLASGEVYYVWVKDSCGNVSGNSATIAVRTVTRSQGTGTTLTTKYDSSSGTAFTSTVYVLNNSKVNVSGSASSGYSNLVLKKDSTTISAGDQTITGNTTFSSSATSQIYTITLDNKDANTAGTASIYEKYATGYYLESSCTNQMTTSANGITIPTKTGYAFGGYYTSASGGTQYINASGKLTSSASNTNFTANGTLYAHWLRTKITINEKVNGNQADALKEFTFTINVKNSGTGISGTYAYTGSKSGNLTFSSGNATFTLHHNQYIDIYFPTGYTYTITQDNGSYTLTKTNDSGTFGSTDITSTFTDTLSSSTPTGLFLDIFPYIILLVSSMGSIFLVSKFRNI